MPTALDFRADIALVSVGCGTEESGAVSTLVVDVLDTLDSILANLGMELLVPDRFFIVGTVFLVGVDSTDL